MIADADLKMYRSAVISTGGTNGGRMGPQEILDGVIANLFPVITPAMRAAGALLYAKAFFKNANDADEAAINMQTWIDYATPGADIITMFPGTQTDTQAGIAGTEAKYGSGKLNASVIAGVSVITVLVESAAKNIFRNTGKIRITDKADPLPATSGNEEFKIITGTPSYAGAVATITLDSALLHGYAAANTRVSSYIETANVKATVSAVVATTAGDGDYNSAFLLADNISSVEQTFTLLWTNTTTFSITGDTLGSLGTGTIAAGASPNNAEFTKPFFVLGPGGFSGTWTAGDTLVFHTSPSAVPMWFQIDIPAGSGATANNEAVAAAQAASA